MPSITGLTDAKHPIAKRFEELASQNMDEYLALPVEKILPPFAPRIQYKNFAWALNKLFNTTLTAFTRECGITISMPDDYMEFISLCEKTSEETRKQILDMINVGYFGNPWWNYASTADGRERFKQIIEHKTVVSNRKRSTPPFTPSMVQVHESVTCLAHFDVILDVVNNFHISYRWLCCSTPNSYDLSKLPYVDDLYDAYTMMQSYNPDNPDHPIPSRNQIILKETMQRCAQRGRG